MLRQTQQFSRRHLDQRKHLTALGNQRFVIWSCDSKCAPESRALRLIKPSLNHQPITEFGCTAIINFGAYYHRIGLLFGHLCKDETKFLDEMCARDLDETQISDIRDDASAIGIEKHHLHFCADLQWGHGRLSNFKFEISKFARRCLVRRKRMKWLFRRSYSRV